MAKKTTDRVDPRLMESIDIAINEIEADLKILGMFMTRFHDRVRRYMAHSSASATRRQHDRVETAFEEFRRALKDAGVEV